MASQAHVIAGESRFRKKVSVRIASASDREAGAFPVRCARAAWRPGTLAFVMRVGWTLGLMAGLCGGFAGGALAACGNGSAGPGPADAASDARVSDAHVDHGEPESGDGAGGDDGGGDEVGCSPIAVDASFPFIPPAAPRASCTTTQVQSLWDSCWSASATSATCGAFYGAPANSTCIACMITPTTASAWGPIVEFPDKISYANAGGCMALAFADAGGAACGAAQGALIRCNNAACSLPCPKGGTANDVAEYNQCGQQAVMTTCAAEDQAASCVSDPAYTGVCVFANFEANFIGLGDFFCAAGSDGGVEGGVDGGVEAAAD